MFPSASNVDSDKDKDQCGKGDTSTMKQSYPSLLQEHRENTRIAKLVKRGSEALTKVIVAQPIQEMQPHIPMEYYGTSSILKETPKLFVGDATP